MRYSSRLNQLAAVFICVSLFIALPTTGHTADKSDAIRQFQKSLIDDEITGSNVVMIHRDGKRIYHKAVQSGKEGDRDIDSKTLFPIWSMTKPITTVAMMILHEQGKFDWDDEVSKFLPSMAKLTWRECAHLLFRRTLPVLGSRTQSPFEVVATKVCPPSL